MAVRQAGAFPFLGPRLAIARFMQIRPNAETARSVNVGKRNGDGGAPHNARNAIALRLHERSSLDWSSNRPS